jgi:signal transduction histidine kinase
MVYEGRQALVGWGVDVTERHAAADALAHAKQAAELANRAKTEFLAAISHELRTPLNAINGFAETMQAEILGPLGNDRYREYCGHIVDAGHHLAGLINDVLDVSRVESGRVALREEPVDPAELVRAALVMVGDRARAADLRLAEALPADLPAIKGDPLRLKQVLLNLMANAVKFTPAGGRVTVRGCIGDDGGVVLEVEDTGIGISPQDQHKLMVAFAQVDSRLERRYQGLGLGLALARSLMELHGGRLEMESAPEQGTRVRMCFPPERVLPRDFTRPPGAAFG